MGAETAICDSIEALQWRYATKRFDPARKLSPDTWKEIEKALLLTPSSYGLQPWKFVVVTNQEIKERLVEFSWGQRQPADCSHLVVITRLEDIDERHINDYIAHMSKVRGVAEESLESLRKLLLDFVAKTPKEQRQEWMARQCYIALGNLMTVAAHHRIDNCPMEGFVKEQYDQILDLPGKGCRSVVLCALGYRYPEDKYSKLAKVRFDSSRVVISI